MRREPKVCRLAAGGEWIRKFSSAMPRHRHQRGRLHSTAEADDCSDDTATPTVDRLQLGRSLETAAYLARNQKLESTSSSNQTNNIHLQQYLMPVSARSYPQIHPGNFVDVDRLPWRLLDSHRPSVPTGTIA